MRHVVSFRLLYLLLGFIFFGYVFIRVLLVDFTHDESYTFLNFIRSSSFVRDILQGMRDAGNHMLNSVLGKLSYMLLGDRPWALRVSSLLAFILFLFFAYKIHKHTRPRALGILGFLLLLSSPMMLEYFGLLRGYAPALMGLLGGLWLVMRQLTGIGKWQSNIWGGAWLAAVAPLSNIAFLNFYLPFFGVLLLWALTEKVLPGVNGFLDGLKRFGKATWPIWLAMLAVYLLTVPPAFRLKGSGLLDFAGSEGFWHDSVGTLIEHNLRWAYGSELQEKLDRIIKIFVGVIAVAGIAVAVTHLYKRWKGKKPLEWHFLYVILLLLWGAAILIWLQHALMGSPFPIDRHAIYFLPLFSLTVTFLFRHLYYAFKPSLLVMAGISGAAVYHTFNVANFYYTDLWYYDAATEEIVTGLHERYLRENRQEPIRVGGHWIFMPTFNYYRAIENQYGVYNMSRTPLLPVYDYWLVDEPAKSRLSPSSYEVEKYYPIPGNYLLRNPQLATDTVIQYRWPEDSVFTIAPGENKQILKWDPDAFTLSDSACVVFVAEGKFEKGGNQLAILHFSAVNNEQATIWEFQSIHMGLIHINDWSKAFFAAAAPPQPGTVHINILNESQVPFHFRKARAAIVKRPARQ